MIHGIDTMQQKSADELKIFYVHPHLYSSEMNSQDSNIQHNMSSIKLPHISKRKSNNVHIPIDNFGNWTLSDDCVIQKKRKAN